MGNINKAHEMTKQDLINLILQQEEEIARLGRIINGEQFQMIENKQGLKKDDILIFKNNQTMVLGGHNMYIIAQYYNENLECVDKPEYDVEKIYRPQYIKVYQRQKNKIK